MVHKVILADNQSVFRTGAARIMATEEDFRIIGQCDDLPRLLKAIIGYPNALVLCAATLQPMFLELVSAARGNGGSVVAILENGAGADTYLADGVLGIIYRDVPSIELLRCLRTVGKGQRFVQKAGKAEDSSFETDAVGARVRERLTVKELKIVALILQGYKNRDIAEELHNSEQVIKNYLRSIFDKTGVSDRLELALFAMHHKLLATNPVAQDGLRQARTEGFTSEPSGD